MLKDFIRLHKMSNQIIKQLSGILNTDDSNENIGVTHHKYAKNIRFRGVGNNYRAENIPGTTLLPNPYLPAGTNEGIGAFYDDLKQRIFTFNYNSSGLHAIYQYTISTQVWARIALVGYNTDGDIFGFTLNGTIYNVKMLYGDATQGDTLYFNNSQKQPCEINIERALTGGYGTIKRTYIDVIKAPSILPPALTYENDGTVTVNNIRRKLFKFKIRFVYDNKEKSVWSSQGELPLPTNYTDTAIDKDPTKNCRIALVVPTGEGDVAKIEIAAAVSEKNTFLDYVLVQTLDKAALGLSDNDITTYRFYNNQAYTPIDVVESIQTQDLVPLTANALEFLNGNVPIYGGITEGFNPITITAANTSTFTPQYTTQPPFVFVSNQSGDSGFGTGNIHTVLIGIVAIGNTYNIYTTNQTVTFVAAATTTASVITGLAAAAVIAGFTVVSSNTENLVIIKTGESLQRTLAVPVLIAISDSFVYDWNSRYSFAIVYFDKAGRTNGALTNITLPVQTTNYTETATVPNIPKIQLSLTSRPPDWAYYYQIVRTKNLSKLKTFYWVSEQTFKDNDFAYISIENLNIFIKNNPSSSFLAYDFSPNDRIRFVKILSDGTSTIYTNNDFDIQAQIINPTINGAIKEGQFLKIALPTTSGTFDFGTFAFDNYFINLYTPAQANSEGLDLYYEFGERYTIGNPTASTRYHQGMLQNQTSNLSQGATFEFTKGDDYLRPRTIQTGGELNYTIDVGEITAGRHTLGVTFVDRSFTDLNIIVGNSPLQSLAGWTYASDTRAILKMAGGSPTTTFKIKGTISVDPLDDDTFTWFFQKQDGTVIYVNAQRGITDSPQIFQVDCSVTLAAGEFISFLGWSEDDYSNDKKYFTTDLKITVDKSYATTIIDQNFSDYFQSAVNSNGTAGRSYIVDVNAQQIFNPTLIRWGLAYQPNTNINQTNRFREINFDEIDRSKGVIQRFKVRDRILRVFQERGVGKLDIFAKFLQDSGNTNILSTTDEIITKNNVQYYAGLFGLGTQPTGLVSSKNADYFVDPVRGYQLRLSGDGITPISELYKGQFYIQPLFIPYNSDYLRLNGARAKILGYYDYAEEQYLTILQGGILNGNTIENQTFSFNEKRNAYCSFYDFHPEWILSANDDTYSFYRGQMYIHNNQTQWCNFYGTQYYPSITLPFNDKILLKKTFLALSYQANKLWTAPNDDDITTSQPNPQTGLPQISKLKDFNFEVQEGIYYAALLKDINSRQDKLAAWHNGDELKGTWLQVTLQYSGNNFVYLYLPYIAFALSGRNL